MENCQLITKKIFKFGMIRVQMALVNSMRLQLIIEFFKAAGVYPYNPLQILKNCKTPISDALTQTILKRFPVSQKIVERR